MALQAISLLLLSCLLSLATVGLFRRWAIRHMLDIPNERSSHETPTPKGGGIGITGTVFLLVSPLFAIEGHWGFLIYLAGAAVIGIVGFIDDNTELPAVVRLLFQTGIALVVVLSVGAPDQIAIPQLLIVTLPAFLAIPVNVFWLLAVTNIYNFMDGIDGFAGTQSVVGGIAWSVFFWLVQEHELTVLSGVIATACLGFLYWNRPPAKIFMGDVGSTFLGLSFGALPLMAYSRLQDPQLLFVGALFIAPFLFDGTLTILRRLVAGENVLKPHRTHLYQRLVKAGYSHGTVVLLYLPLMVLSAVTGFGVWYETAWLPILAILLLATGISLVIHVAMVERRQAILQA